jgi:hypothetical protein
MPKKAITNFVQTTKDYGVDFVSEVAAKAQGYRLFMGPQGNSDDPKKSFIEILGTTYNVMEPPKSEIVEQPEKRKISENSTVEDPIETETVIDTPSKKSKSTLPSTPSNNNTSIVDDMEISIDSSTFYTFS